MSAPEVGAGNLVLKLEGAVATIAFNRPEKLNPLDWECVKELHARLQELARDPGLRVVVVTGRGRAFSAGGDLESYIDLYRRADDFRRYLQDFHALMELIERSPLIVIAAVNGACVAGGLELMLACDLVIASAEAKIGDGHLNFGQLPGGGGSQRLPRAIGALRAKELMLSGRLLDGSEAERIGLVSRAVPAAELEAATEALVAELLAKSPAGLKGAKHLINEGLRGTLEAGLEMERDYVHDYATTCADATEGLLAFKEKRAPRFAPG